VSGESEPAERRLELYIKKAADAGLRPTSLVLVSVCERDTDEQNGKSLEPSGIPCIGTCGGIL